VSIKRGVIGIIIAPKSSHGSLALRLGMTALSLLTILVPPATAIASQGSPYSTISVATYTVRAHRISASATLGGTVIPYREVTLSAQIPGRVEQIAGEEGESFAEGDALVAIDDDDLLAQRRAALAQVANADSILRNAGVQYQREWNNPYSETDNSFAGMPSVFRQFVNPMRTFAGSSQPFQDRTAQLYSYGSRVEQARNSMVQARSKIDEIDARLRDAQGIAPFDGMILKKLVEVGDTVQPGMPLLQFADTSYLRIQANVPARLLPGLEVGMVVNARLDVGNTHTRARVARIYPMADPTRHTVIVKFDLPRGTPGGPGMYAEVSVPNQNVEDRVRPVVPYASLVWRGSLPAVLVVNDNDETDLRLVRIGEKLDDRYVTVLSGIRPGERIVANPQPDLPPDWPAQGEPVYPDSSSYR